MEGAGAGVAAEIVVAGGVSWARTSPQTPRKSDVATEKTASKDFMIGRA